MAPEYRKLDIWVGNFPGEPAIAEYLAEAYSDDDSVPISRFAADMGESFYDHDFLERSFHESSSTDLGRILAAHSFAPFYAGAAAIAYDSASLPAINTVLLVWGAQFKRPVSVQHGDYWLHYLGRFDCASTPDQVL